MKNSVSVRHLLAACAVVSGGVSACAYGAGPDVIVGDLYNRSNFTSTGAVGGIRAYAIGTVSCNIGTAPLQWIASNNQHPVISQNMFKLVNGRFEHIGQAWLKHGFTALQGTVCDTCPTPNPTGAALAVGCSDPYDSGLNGQQSRLGPKSEVNAFSGAFLYPWALAGTGSGTLFKRLQVADADLTTGDGSVYVVSSMYVASDDAASSNHWNNASYRRVTIDATSKDITLADTTQRQIPPIFAWRDHGGGPNIADPNVYIYQWNVPSEGRFFVGAKATSAGGGLWDYEYAVYNLNSDRSGGSFSVPVPAGAVVTNIGFHDVAYHSGEPYSGTDWTGVATGGSVTWTVPQNFAANANANALRWDTLYNFRFRTNFPPAIGTGTLGLFKPGTGTSITGSTIVPTVGGVLPPQNDLCSSPTSVSAGSIAFDTTNANTDGPTACVSESSGSTDTQIGKDLWYRWTNGSFSGTATISTCGSAFDTKLAVYADNCGALGTALGCDDDTAGCANNGSQVTFAAAANTSYLIRVGGYTPNAGTTASGTGTLSIVAPGPVIPSNDACANAQWVAAGVTVNATTVASTNDGTASCGNSGTSPDIWYKYQPTSNASVQVNLCGSGYDTVLSVYTGSCGALTQVACNDDNTGAGGNSVCGTTGGMQLDSGVTVAMTAGTTYLIRVAGYNGATGSVVLNVVGGGGIIPPTGPLNDDCANRAGIGLGTHAFTTVGATTDGISHACGQTNNDVWYNFPSLLNGQLIISTSGTSYQSKIVAYGGYGCADYATRFQACSNSSPTPNGARVKVPVTEGGFTTFRLGANTAGQTGAGQVTLRVIPTCIADTDDGSGTGTTDGGVGIEDLLYYLGQFEAGGLAADVDDGSGDGYPDSGVGIEDLLYYLGRFESGC